MEYFIWQSVDSFTDIQNRLASCDRKPSYDHCRSSITMMTKISVSNITTRQEAKMWFRNENGPTADCHKLLQIECYGATSYSVFLIFIYFNF